MQNARPLRPLVSGLAAAGASALVVWVGWGLYSNKTTERVQSETLASFADVEIRRYPRTISVETTAQSNEDAFRRLFSYIAGANESSEEVSMTAPVASDTAGDGDGVRPDDGERVDTTAPVRTESEEVSMTSPVRTTDSDGTTTMSFYLPAEYTPATAPTPTDSRVRLVVQPPQTLAVQAFSWWASDRRVAMNRRALLDTLATEGVDTRGSPFLLQYNDPYTPPFMRRNEVAVEVAWDDERE